MRSRRRVTRPSLCRTHLPRKFSSVSANWGKATWQRHNGQRSRLGWRRLPSMPMRPRSTTSSAATVLWNDTVVSGDHPVARRPHLRYTARHTRPRSDRSRGRSANRVFLKQERPYSCWQGLHALSDAGLGIVKQRSGSPRVSDGAGPCGTSFGHPQACHPSIAIEPNPIVTPHGTSLAKPRPAPRRPH